MKTSFYLLLFLFALPSVAFSQSKVDSTLAMLLDAKAYQLLLTNDYQSKKHRDSILILYQDRLYPSSSIYPQPNMGNGESIKIVNHPDSIQKILADRIKTIIVIDRKVNDSPKN